MSTKFFLNALMLLCAPLFAQQQFTPNDPEFSNQGVLRLLRVPEAWNITTGDTTVIIGIIDSGIDYDHPDLFPNIYINPGEWGVNGELSNNGIDDDGNGYVDDFRGWDFVGDGSAVAPLPDNDPMDRMGRGTGVAGCASAASNNGIGIASPGYRTKLLPVKVTPDSSLSLVSTAEAIRYAADMGCKIITCSWNLNTEIDPLLSDAVNYAADRGALVISNMGRIHDENDIGGTAPSDVVFWDAFVQRAFYVMGYGEPGNGWTVDINLPASHVMTTKQGGGYFESDSNNYATGYVSGIAALVAAKHPTWTGDQIGTRIKAATTSAQGEKKTIDAYLAVSDSVYPGMRIKRVEIDYPNGQYLARIGETAKIKIIIENALPYPASNFQVAVHYYDQHERGGSNYNIGNLPGGDSVSLEYDVTISEALDYTSPYLRVTVLMHDDRVRIRECFFVRLQLDGTWLPCLQPKPGNAHQFTGMDAVNKDIVWMFGYPLGPYTGRPYGKSRVFLSTDGGTQWHIINGKGFPSMHIVTAIAGIDANTGLVTAGTGLSTYVYRTSNRGATWDSCDVGAWADAVSVLHMFDENEGLLIGENEDKRVVFCKTYDGGKTWGPITQQFVRRSAPVYNRGADFIGNAGWVGTYDSVILTTTNRGVTWDSLRGPEPVCQMISFFDNSTVAVACANRYNLGDGYSYLTSDGGATWTRMHDYIRPVQGSLFLAEPQGSRLWFSNVNYLRVSDDSGKTSIDNRKPSTLREGNGFLCWDIIVANDTTYAWIGWAEVYKKTVVHNNAIDTTVGVPELPFATGLSLRASPVPFTSSTNIIYNIPLATQVKLTVYDQLGREVKVLVNGTKSAGTYTVTFDAGDLPSGMYLYRIETKQGTVSKKMVLMR